MNEGSRDFPRCASCMWWGQPEGSERGLCVAWAVEVNGQVAGLKSAWDPPFPKALWTPPDFGCPLHEADEGDE